MDLTVQILLVKIARNLAPSLSKEGKFFLTHANENLQAVLAFGFYK